MCVQEALWRWLAPVVGMLVVGPLASAAVVSTKIADGQTVIPGGTGNFTSFSRDGVGQPALGGGTVAFYGQGASEQEGIYRYDAGQISRVIDKTTPVPGGTSDFSSIATKPWADGGNVVFVGYGAWNSKDGGVYRHNGQNLLVIADRNTIAPGQTRLFSSFGPFAYHDGHCAFNGLTSSREGIYSDAGGTLSVVADTTTAIPGGTGNFQNLNSLPVPLDSQNVAFNGTSYSPYQLGIYTNAGGALEVVADFNTPIPGRSENFRGLGASSGDDGALAFLGHGANYNDRGLYTWDDGALDVVVDTTMPIPGGTGLFTDFSRPSLDGGNVAFVGLGPSGQTGVYVRYRGSLIKLIDRTHLLDGKEIYTFDAGPDCLEGADVAFRATFMDSSQAIYVATIPEPATLSLLGLAGPALRRQRRTAKQ